MQELICLPTYVGYFIITFTRLKHSVKMSARLSGLKVGIIIYKRTLSPFLHAIIVESHGQVKLEITTCSTPTNTHLLQNFIILKQWFAGGTYSAEIECHRKVYGDCCTGSEIFPVILMMQFQLLAIWTSMQ